jgi:hypothetical protein
MASAVATWEASWQTKTKHRTPRTASSKEDMHMRKTIAGFVLAASLAAVPGMARADGPGAEVAFSALAAAGNLFYTPAKVLVAAVGLPVGAVAGFLNGGDTRAAYAFWVPMAGGRYFLTADQMDGNQPVEFFGSDYKDKPSEFERTHFGCSPYDAKYMRR